MIKNCDNVDKILAMLPHNNARIEFQTECDEFGLKVLEVIQPLYAQVFSRFSFKKFKQMVLDLIQENKEHHAKYYENIPFENSESSSVYLEILSDKIQFLNTYIKDEDIQEFVKLKNKGKIDSIFSVLSFFHSRRCKEGYDLEQEKKFPKLLDLDTVQGDVIYFTYPKTNLDLKPLAQDMQSCLSCYGERIFFGRELKIIAHKDSYPYCSIGFNMKGEVVQMKLKRNFLPNPNSHYFKKIEKALSKIGLDFTEHKKFLIKRDKEKKKQKNKKKGKV